MTNSTKRSDTPRPWVNGQIANGRRFIPNVPVVTHLGDSKLFYDDLVRDRCVVFQFTSTTAFGDYPVTRNLRNVQKHLGQACGQDVFLFTITTDPLNDTPERFAKFADRFSPGPGWLFLSGERIAVESIKRALFVHSSIASSWDGSLENGSVPTEVIGRETSEASGSEPIDQINGTAKSTVDHDHHHDCSLGLLRYGNDASGLWGSVPTKLDPQLIVQRLQWIQPRQRKQSPNRLVRKGPLRVGPG